MKLTTLLCLFLTTISFAQEEAPKKILLAISKTDHTLSLLDPSTFKVLNKLPIGKDPHEVVASSDGTKAYVSNTGSGLFHEINVLDLVEKKALPDIDTGALTGPHGMVYVGDKLWFTSEGSKSIGRYDPKENKIDLVVGIGENRTHMIHVSDDEKHIYASNVDSATISIIDYLLMPPPIPPIGAPLATAKPQMKWMQKLVPAGIGSEGFDVNIDGTELWTADAHAGTITIIDLEKKKVKSKIFTKTLGISRVKFTNDGKRVLISSLRTGDLLIYDVKTKKLVKKIDLGIGAAHILMDPDLERAFVSCTPDGFIAVIDLKKLEVSSHIDIGPRPDGLDWAISK